MSARSPHVRHEPLGRRIAGVLRVGTIVAVALIGIGFAWSLARAGRGPGGIPIIDLVIGGGPNAVIGLGLLGLTLVPGIVLAVAAASFATAGERRHLVMSLIVLALLVASLVVASLVAATS